MLASLVNLYSFVVFAAVMLSWFPGARDNPVARFIESATEPVFERVRRVIPPAGGFDLSPMLVLFALQILRRVLR
jgi:YggT family protein